MPAKVTPRRFDFSSCSVAEAKGAILARLQPSGSGHTAFCVFRGAEHQPHAGCASQPRSWLIPAAMEAALEDLKVSGAVCRVGAYLWLRPGRSAVIASQRSTGTHGGLPSGDSGRAQQGSQVR